jgi:hypothetical protein
MCFNIVIAAVLFALPTTAGPTFVVYGTSMLVATLWRAGGCEVTAFYEVVERELAGGETAPLLPDHGCLQEVRGRVAVRDALRSYERALELDPAFGRAHRQRIQALVALGQAHDAVRLYERRRAAQRGRTSLPGPGLRRHRRI